MEGASGTEGGVPQTAGVETQPAIGTQEESRWTEARSKLTKDTLGHRRDERILETVIGLEVVGLNTIKSCEGHMDGISAPYIDVGAKDTVDIAQLYEMLAKEETRDTAKKLSEETTRLNLKEREKLMGHLSIFYQNRQVPYDRRLTIQSGPLGVSRVESQGAGLQKICGQEVKQQRLQEYQEEMREFALFLKKGVKLSTEQSSLQDKQQEKAAPVVPTAEPGIVEKVEKVDLSEQVAKLEKFYAVEERQRQFAMAPFWLACAQVLNRPPKEVRQFTTRWNPSRVKAILEDGAEGLEDIGYTNNRDRLRVNFDRHSEPIAQAREEVIESIKELAPFLTSEEAIEKQTQAVAGLLKDLNRRLSYMDFSFQLHPASFYVILRQRPEWGASVADNIAWVTIASALAKYMNAHYSGRMLKS